jgi:hypothetical protein
MEQLARRHATEPSAAREQPSHSELDNVNEPGRQLGKQAHVPRVQGEARKRAIRHRAASLGGIE